MSFDPYIYERSFKRYCMDRLVKEQWHIYPDEWNLMINYMEGVIGGYEEPMSNEFYEWSEDNDDYSAWVEVRKKLFSVIPEEVVRGIIQMHETLNDEGATDDEPFSELERIQRPYRKPFASMLAIYDQLAAINHPEDVEADDAALPDDI